MGWGVNTVLTHCTFSLFSCCSSPSPSSSSSSTQLPFSRAPFSFICFFIFAGVSPPTSLTAERKREKERKKGKTRKNEKKEKERERKKEEKENKERIRKRENKGTSEKKIQKSNNNNKKKKQILLLQMFLQDPSNQSNLQLTNESY
jgi:hypothetical protein